MKKKEKLRDMTNILYVEQIHEDKRGSINLLKGPALQEHEEITIFTCKEGFARGGCIHKEHDEFCVVFEGEIIYYIEKPTIPFMKMHKGDIVKIPKNTPHYFVAKTDCIVAEWGATPEEKLDKHKEFRKIVETINDQV